MELPCAESLVSGVNLKKLCTKISSSNEDIYLHFIYATITDMEKITPNQEVEYVVKVNSIDAKRVDCSEAYSLGNSKYRNWFEL